MLACEEVQSRRPERGLASEFWRNHGDGGNLMRIYTNICEVINGNRLCKVLFDGRSTYDLYTSKC